MNNAVNKVILYILVLSLALALSGCNLPRTVRDPEIREYNGSLKAEFSEIKRIRVNISRPVLHWDIHVGDLDREEEIFRTVAAFLRQSDIYAGRMRDEYTGIYSFWTIDITLICGNTRRTYEGHYYQPGTTIYPDDGNNVINNFADWDVFENSAETGLTVHTG